jgi:soluble lytic murein transglycosylase-like protein
LKLKIILASSFIVAFLAGCSENNPALSPISPDIKLNTSDFNNYDFQKFIQNHSYKLDKNSANTIGAYISYYSKLNSVDPKLVLAVIARESNFRPNAVSSAGAMGLGQLMKPTAKEMGVKNAFDPQDNIKGTTRYLSWLLKRTKGNLDKTLASYNMGPAAVESVLSSGGKLPSGVKKYVSDIKYFYTKV